MTLIATKTKTLAVQDLDLDATYQGSPISELLNPEHSYKVVQKTEDAYLQPCSMCDRENQARFRVTILNTTTGEIFYAGRVCLEKYFGVTFDELGKSTALLAQLARTWQAYKNHAGDETDFDSTRDAVQDMRHRFLSLADQGIKPFKEAAQAVERILNDLAHINDYQVDVRALQSLLAIAYETTYKANLLDDRIVNLRYHPLLAPHERSEAVRVLKAQDVTWYQVRALTEKLISIRKKGVSLKIRQVPGWNFSSEAEYHEGLRAYAHERLHNLDERDDPYMVHRFQDEMRRTVHKLRGNGGFYELVFEGWDFATLKRLTIPSSLQKSVDTAGGVCLISAEPVYHLRYAPTSTTHHSVDAMMKAFQQDEGYDQDQIDEKPQEWFYRTVVLYLPDTYLASYAKWSQYGGVQRGRKYLEDLTSELLPA